MKKILMFGSIAAFSFAANASYLYWTVDQSYKMDNTGATYVWSDDAGAGTYQTGKLNVIDGTGQIIDSSDEFGYQEVGGQQALYNFDVSNYATGGYSFFVELLAYDLKTEKWGQIGQTGSMTYDSLAKGGVILSGGEMAPVTLATVQTVWHSAGMNAPEPTSAMLMLLGVAGLALRRKQRKLA